MIESFLSFVVYLYNLYRYKKMENCDNSSSVHGNNVCWIYWCPFNMHGIKKETKNKMKKNRNKKKQKINKQIKI